MTATMSCNRCGASITATAPEVIKWDISHDESCPALVQKPDDSSTGADRG